MRPLPTILMAVMLLSPAEAQQSSPPVSTYSPPPTVKAYPRGASPTVDELQKLPPGAMVSFEIENGGDCRTTVIAAITALKQGGEICAVGPKPEPPCEKAEAAIADEQRNSSEHLRELQRRGEVVSVLQQYEQEMYYEDRRTKLYQKFCQRPAPTAYGGPTREMRTRICAASPTSCKPVKHW